jgi:hypothetical protein
VTSVQNTFIRKPDDADILKSDAPALDGRVFTVPPPTPYVSGDRIVEIKVVSGPGGELLLSFLHASGKHRLQPVRSLDVLIRQLAAGTAAPGTTQKTKDLAAFSKGRVEAGRQNTD